jgi:hypothetical protein
MTPIEKDKQRGKPMNIDPNRVITKRAQSLLEGMIPYSWLGPEADGNMVVNQAAKFVHALSEAGLLTKELSPLDVWIEENFTGHGVAVRARDDRPIPGEPLMSMAIAKELTRRAVSKFCGGTGR